MEVLLSLTRGRIPYGGGQGVGLSEILSNDRPDEDFVRTLGDRKPLKPGACSGVGG